MLILFVPVLQTAYSQRIEIGSGAELVMGSGTDICATALGNISGNITGPGTQCDGPLPVLISSFTAGVENTRDVRVSWTTSMEINNKGFEIERKQSGGTWVNAGWLNGYGNSSNPVTYVFMDKKLDAGKYNYRLKQFDYNGNFEYHVCEYEAVVSQPSKFGISQNYPNPSNPVSKIDFQLPSAGKVSIRVYDISGREVALLVDEIKDAGFYSVTFDGSKIASGVYFYKIEAAGFVEIRKMVLIK
jgi:hypothetical protein